MDDSVAGVYLPDREGGWRTKIGRRSPRYTTRLGEVLTINRQLVI
jgi:hypothetical protein